ncbi:helix-turn-helix domain-containing protein [Streptococcus suis]|uniref:helix-turn-helix domain-containing protein n=1 Tax=Streptococcus suis TaxID=1307 RepID=UPI000CF5D29C|nr:helix-turn-helix transcriptional regulator [Streptococcus suis]
MRWDIGKVYKQIRESKGIKQTEVVGKGISRQALISFEKGQSTPRYETMHFLLQQLDMDFAEFDYICNYHQPSKRQEIFTDFAGQVHSTNPERFKVLLKKCQDYLKTHQDLPIQHLSELSEIMYKVRKSGIEDIEESTKKLTEKIWKELEKRDNWYWSDIRMLNTILYFFPIDSVNLVTEGILKTLDKYKDFVNTKTRQLTILENLSTLYLYHNRKKDCRLILDRILCLSKEERRYDILAFAQVRYGICTDNDELIEKGLQLLELMEETGYLSIAKKEIEQFR